MEAKESPPREMKSKESPPAVDRHVVYDVSMIAYALEKLEVASCPKIERDAWLEIVILHAASLDWFATGNPSLKDKVVTFTMDMRARANRDAPEWDIPALMTEIKKNYPKVPAEKW